MSSLPSGIVCFGVSFLLAVSLASAQGPRYDFQVVAATGASINGNKLTDILDRPQLNDKGEVVFVASFSSGQGIFASGKVLAKTGDEIDGKKLSWIANPSLNEHGYLVFQAGFADGSGIFTRKHLIVRTGDTIDGQRIQNFFAGTTVNNRGEIAFEAATGFDYPTGYGVFLASERFDARLLTKAGDLTDGKALRAVGVPVINERGLVAFRGEFYNPSDPNDTGMVTVNARNGGLPGLEVESGTTVDHRTVSVFDFPAAVTKDDIVVVKANFEGGSGIFGFDPKGNNHLIFKVGDQIASQAIRQIGQVSVSSNGTVGFLAAFNGGQGIFTPSTMLVKTGQQIGLNKLTSILYNATAFNSQGQIAFVGKLSNGSTAVIVGTPLAGSSNLGSESQEQ